MKTNFEIIKEIEFDDVENAKKIYKRERFMLKIRLIFAICAVCWSVYIFLFRKELGIFEYILGIPGLIGLLGTTVTCPIIILRTFLSILIGDSHKERWYNPAYFLVDIFLFIVALLIPIFILAFLPCIFCIAGVFQSYTNKNDARTYLLKHIGGKEFLKQF